MKPEYKLMLRGLLVMLPAFFFLVWGLSDILSVTGGSIDLLILIPVIMFSVVFIILGVIIVVGIILKRRHVLYKEKYRCKECGAVINLEEKYCAECGAENTIRYEALEKLEDMERKIEDVKGKRSEKRESSKWPKTRRTEKLQEIDDEMLYNREREVRIKKTKLIIGSTREGKLEWIKTQYYDLNRTIQDIADDLGESMMTVRKFLNEIEKLR